MLQIFLFGVCGDWSLSTPDAEHQPAGFEDQGGSESREYGYRAGGAHLGPAVHLPSPGVSA